MGTTYKATFNLECFKQHTCVGCESKYSYLLSREITGEAATEQGAAESAEKLALTAVEAEVKLHACPQCGVIQPEMTADVRSVRFWFALIVVAIGLATALILGVSQVVTIAISGWIAVGVVLLTTMLFAWGAFYNPNRNLELNRSESQNKVAQQTLSLDKANQLQPPMLDDQHGGLAAANMLSLAMVLFAALLCTAPLLVATLKGWTMNAVCYPAVVGPGDTSRFYFNQKIKSIKGFWNGTTDVSVANLEELGVDIKRLKGKTKDSSWGDSISGKSVSEATNTMWMNVTFPDDEALAGKKLDLKMNVGATYPFEIGGGFDDAFDHFEHKAPVILSSAGAGTMYHRLWWIGQLAAVVLCCFAGFMLQSTCKALRNRANPIAIAPVMPEGEAEDITLPEDSAPPA